MPPNDDTPRAGKLPVATDNSGHIARPLPTTKTVADALAKRATETGDPASAGEPDAVASGAALMSYNEEVLSRLAKVQAFFTAKNLGKPFDPTQAKAFSDFVRDHLAFVNMRYVTLGRFDRPGAEEPSTKGGFQPLPAVQDELPDGLDPFLRSMRSTRLAMENGADILGDDSQPEPA